MSGILFEPSHNNAILFRHESSCPSLLLLQHRMELKVKIFFEILSQQHSMDAQLESVPHLSNVT